MANPKISIITATRNRPDLLKRCIMAIQQQDWDDYEHIIVADHCKYAKAVFNEFKEDKHLRYGETGGEHVENHGAIGKNKGIEMARGEYITYCDDDNVLLPKHSRKLYELLEQGHNVVMTGFYQMTIPPGDLRTFNIMNTNLSETLFNTQSYLADKSGLDIISYDMLCCGHRKNLYPKRLKWPTAAEVGPNEDGRLMAYLGVPNSILPGGCFPPMPNDTIKNLGLDPDPKIGPVIIDASEACAVYVSAGHLDNDEVYKEKLKKLKGTYVYPELLTKDSIGETNG